MTEGLPQNPEQSHGNTTNDWEDAMSDTPSFEQNLAQTEQHEQEAPLDSQFELENGTVTGEEIANSAAGYMQEDAPDKPTLIDNVKEAGAMLGGGAIAAAASVALYGALISGGTDPATANSVAVCFGGVSIPFAGAAAGAVALSLREIKSIQPSNN